MLTTKTIRIIVTEEEKNKIFIDSFNHGFSNISDYLRSMLFRRELLRNKIEILLANFEDKNGSD